MKKMPSERCARPERSNAPQREPESYSQLPDSTIVLIHGSTNHQAQDPVVFTRQLACAFALVATTVCDRDIVDIAYRTAGL